MTGVPVSIIRWVFVRGNAAPCTYTFCCYAQHVRWLPLWVKYRRFLFHYKFFVFGCDSEEKSNLELHISTSSLHPSFNRLNSQGHGGVGGGAWSPATHGAIKLNCTCLETQPTRGAHVSCTATRHWRCPATMLPSEPPLYALNLWKIIHKTGCWLTWL